MEYNDLTFARHLAGLASLRKPALIPALLRLLFCWNWLLLQTHQSLFCFLQQTTFHWKAKHFPVISTWTTGKSHLLSIGSKFLKMKILVCTRSSISLVISSTFCSLCWRRWSPLNLLSAIHHRPQKLRFFLMCRILKSTHVTQHRKRHPGYPAVQLRLTCDQIRTGSESLHVK